MKNKKKKRGPPATKGKTLPRDLLDENELARLMEACGDGDAADRNRAFIAMLAATGIRMSEALDLVPHDVDLGKRVLVVRSNHNKPSREVWIHPDAISLAKRWYKVRSELGLSDCPVFCNLDGGRLNPSYIRALLPDLAKLAGITKRVYADGIRNIFARRAHEAKATRRSIQLQFGHANITTTVAMLERLGLHEGFAEFEESL